MYILQGGQKTWKNLEFNNLGKKKPGVFQQNHGKTWNFFLI